MNKEYTLGHHEGRPAMKATPKRYKCRDCGHIETHTTNHTGLTWSWGRFHTCPNCPPWKKYPEYGGQTVWDLVENQEEAHQKAV